MKQPRLMLLAPVLAGLFALTAQAAMVMKMDLDTLVGNADKVFRGTVTDVKPGTVEAGGSALPIVIYTLKVQESIKGDFGPGGDGVVELRMLGDIKVQPAGAGVQRAPLTGVNPGLELGKEYVLFTTAPSRVGLSTTVGLDQGLFRVFSDGSGQEMVANGLNNQGLFDGPANYDEVRAAVSALVNK